MVLTPSISTQDELLHAILKIIFKRPRIILKHVTLSPCLTE